MDQTYAAYLAFARGLTDRFADRVIGIDPSLARLVQVRPADQVLGGFLTPPRRREHADEAGPVEDLPQDSPYEQTALGFEWLAPYAALTRAVAEVQVTLSLFVRVFPTFDEQQRYGSWKRPWLRKDARPAVKPEESAEIIPAWQRVDLDPITVRVDLDTLAHRRKLVLPLGQEIQALWSAARLTVPRLYDRSAAVRIARGEFRLETFDSWCASLGAIRVAENWAADLDVRLTTVPTGADCGRISLRVVNRTPSREPREMAFFDPNLYAVRLQAALPAAAHRDMRFRELEQSYRYDLHLAAVGLNTHPLTERRGDVIVMCSDVVPRKETGRLEPRQLENVRPTFASLAADPVPILRQLLAAMRRYDATDWQAKIDELRHEQRHEAERDRGRFRTDEIAALERGIRLLEDHRYPHVLRAFRHMNEAMGYVASGEGLDPEKVKGRRTYDAWRLFQIVFIVAQLPMLAGREYPELALPGDDRVEVLWFAAGGGKTEAFFGLIVWQMFFDRLRGKRFGTAAMVRFPLRLLAFQQLQRLARALAVADLIRQREKLGGARFSLGYYVGSTQTPNAVTDERHQRYKSQGVDPLDRRLTECPYCAADVSGRYDAKLRLVEHYCTNLACSAARERLPIYIVDRDIERYLPTVVVATVDKLAQFGQQQRFANLFGRISLMCCRHGASFLNTEGRQCAAAEAVGAGGRPTSCDGYPVLYPPFKDLVPALLVQDELHLLSEELGTFDAHYETAVMQLARTLGGQPWKIVAATATIADFDRHAQQLYLKDARQFPAPGPDAYESFYYSLDRDAVARIFVGVLGVGRKHTPAVTRGLSVLYQELHQARRYIEAGDLDSVQARYGLPALSAPMFAEILFHYELVLTYVLTRRGSDQVAEAIQSRVKRELEELERGAGDLRIETFNSNVEMTAMMESMRRIERADRHAPPVERTRGLVTTNIISHGVDVDRFNIILFAGFTRLVAEYIQASARVGRRFPGISILVATPQSERDRSIYERFAKFHEYLDRLVDPSAVNRWPVPALQRTAPGLVAGYLMGGAAGLMNRRLENVGRVQEALGSVGSEPLREEAIVEWLQEALGSARKPGYGAEVERAARRYYALVVNSKPSSSYMENLLNQRLGSMRSLRDVDEPADIVIEDRDAVAIMRGLRRA